MASLKNSWLSRVGIVVLAAVMVEILSIVQYEHVQKALLEETDLRSRVVMNSMAEEIQHTLERTEITMRENLWDIKRSMAHPDSVFEAVVRLIDDDRNLVGGCLAFRPYFYPSKGRLYEPYASLQPDGTIKVEQIAGPDHDYTLNEEYMWVLDNRCTSWTDPYKYGPDSLAFTTYLLPIYDNNGQIDAVCGLDMDLSWLGDTLNSRQPYPSSFGLLLTPEGELVAGPSKSRTPEDEVKQVVDLLNGLIPASDLPGVSYSSTRLFKDPYWLVVEVYKTDEVYARVRRQRRQQVLFIILGLAILSFMINRYARNERKLRQASEEKARMGGELAVAHRIQQQMLPKTFPPFVYGSLEPALEVGGDLFDFYTRDGKLFFCIGDVTGKGVPSAMLMSVAHSLFRILSQKIDNPSRILEFMNKELSRGNDSNMFITFFVGCLDLYSGELRFSNAGHDKPFVISSDISLLPSKSNLPLAAFPDTQFEEQTFNVAPGTVLLLYTDGLTEAKNMDRKSFGRPRIQEVLENFRSNQDQSLSNLVSTLSEAAHSFAGEAPQSDDLTMLAIRFDPENNRRDQITLVNKESEVTRLGSFVKDFLAPMDLDKKLASGLRLALEEAVVNVIDYAYPAGEQGEILINADTNGHEVRFTITDSGYPFDPTTVLKPDTTLDAQNRPIGGLGIFLSRKLMDSISYNRIGAKNVLSLTKFIL
jgi:serine phosphatase RsbU (regulator of sigma subunit)/anti-sigma regulatory factor (Ser/Thr protein kinase)